MRALAVVRAGTRAQRGTGHGDRGAAVGDQRAAVRRLAAKRRSPLMTRRAKKEASSVRSGDGKCGADWHV
jgi:hypothetical protein